MQAVKKSRSTKPKKPIKRRTQAELDGLKADIYQVASEENPMTIRHLFYRLVSVCGWVKTEQIYKGTLIRLLGIMRESGEIPFEWFVDSTRWMRKPRTHDSVTALLKDCWQTYRRELWREQPVYCEVWTEKDAIASILWDITEQFDVPLMVCRGFSSKTFLYSTGQKIKEQGKPTHIFYLGDFDPSGLSISTVIERGLRKYSDDAEIHFTRLGVTEQQIIDLNLPTRPTKATDSRAKNFVGESVEIDAISAAELKVLVNNAIVGLIDPNAFWAVKAAEDSERDTLGYFYKRVRDDLDGITELASMMRELDEERD
jgi:hypothetical protein